jgi:hypothetical protein
MTQVLDTIRRLDEALERQEISEARYAALRREVLELVEEGEVAEGPAPAPARNETADLLKNALLLLFGLVILTVLLAWATQDVMLALTASVVLLAGFVVNAARGLIAEDRAEAEAKASKRRAPKTPAPALDTYDEKGRAVAAE